MNPLVLRQDNHGTAVLTLNRPDKLNALSKDLFEELEAHLDDIARHPRRIGLVILRGAGGTFSAGYDMQEIAAAVRGHAKPHYQFDVIEKLAHLPQPVISAVQGVCSTGALELALAADLIAASESARFSDAYARWGLTPVWGLSLRLPRRIGTAKARELILTCRTVSGQEARAMDLANFCYPDDRFEAELESLARQILANSWFANQINKQVLMQTDALPIQEAQALEIFKNEGLAPDAASRIAGFFKREDK
jgi:enoyl-CoA hydratase/carnithine racemase